LHIFAELLYYMQNNYMQNNYMQNI